MCIDQHSLFIEHLFIRRHRHTVYCQQSTVYVQIRTNVLLSFSSFEIKRFISKYSVYSLLLTIDSLLSTVDSMMLTVEC